MHFRENMVPKPIEEIGTPVPYLLAEQLPLAFLERQVALSSALRADNWYPERKLIHKAWAYLELGLSTEIDDRSAEEAFSMANETALEIQGEENQLYHHVLDAQILRAYMPAFRNRRAGRLQSDTKAPVLAKLVGSYEDIDDREFKNENDVVGHLVKVTAHAAFLRRKRVDGVSSFSEGSGQKLEVYPASAREHMDHDRQQFNHDFVAIAGGQKGPIAIRSRVPSTKRRRNGGYDKGLLFMAFSKIANNAFGTYGLATGDEIVYNVAELVEEEVSGTRLETSQQAALDAITSTLTIASLEHILDLRATNQRS